jgi:GTPase
VPLVVVVTKVDAVPEHVAVDAVASVRAYVSGRLRLDAEAWSGSHGRSAAGGPDFDHACRRDAVVVADEASAAAVAAEDGLLRHVPVVAVSNVTRQGYSALLAVLRELRPRHGWAAAALTMPPDFHIEDVFSLGSNTIAAGMCVGGTISAGMRLALGPDFLGKTRDVVVASLHVRRKAVATVSSGDIAALGLVNADGTPLHAAYLRRGQCLTASGGHREPWAMGFRATVKFTPAFLSGAHRQLRAGKHVVAYIAGVRQPVRILDVEVTHAGASGRSCVGARFLHQPEHVHAGAAVLLRDGDAVATGFVTTIVPHVLVEGGLLPARAASRPPAERKQRDRPVAAGSGVDAGVSSDDDGIFGSLGMDMRV